ncbi:hypothetical protein KC19_11G023300 [Ceratodon purpureus]|uniref:Exostosin GT47 domain-containing protein n=1 Tax=Ceratodon purpureus TaxID=3225 RepID=A0A8T0GC18_CERPU|nr:hypothetical protein KC19_11G023300 [Ceratodon purpureus]
MELTVPQALLLSFLIFLLLSALLFPNPFALLIPSNSFSTQPFLHKPAGDAPCLDPLKVYVVDLAREFNYGLLEDYYKSRNARGSRDLWLGEEPHDGDPLEEKLDGSSELGEFMPYPKNPNWRQYSAEYWLLADLLTEELLRAAHSAAVKVSDMADADVFLVPFFCALSAEIQLGEGHGKFRKKMEENRDYVRQRKVMEFVTQTSAWRRSGGRDHVFMLTDPMAMWHVRAEIARSILLVVDFGGWYMEDAKAGEKAKVYGDGMPSNVIAHTDVSLTKDVIVPYTHLLPTLSLAESSPRDVLLYFRGARHRHRTGLVREKLWTVLGNEPGVILEEGFPNSTGREEALRGMRRSHFCLNPAGDTPTSSRLFDSIANLCIPVIVSDTVELPFEGILNYSTFAVFVSVNDAMSPGTLVQQLRNMNTTTRSTMRERLRDVQRHFEYENGHPGGRGSTVKDGAVQLIWRMVKEKVPGLKATITREHRKFPGSISPRCLCT